MQEQNTYHRSALGEPVTGNICFKSHVCVLGLEFYFFCDSFILDRKLHLSGKFDQHSSGLVLN